MRKRKASKKGGFNNPVRAGPTIPEQLSKYDKKNIEGLKDTYEINVAQSQKELDRYERLKKEATETYMKKNLEDIKQSNLNKGFRQLQYKQIKDSFNGLWNLTKGLFSLFAFCIKFIISNIQFAFKFMGTAGQGAIIKAILAILFIVLVILGATGTLYRISGSSSTLDKSNEWGQTILSENDNSYLSMPKTDNIFSMMYDKINNLIPFEYKYKMDYISNSVSYLATGKNQYDAYLQDRDEITSGRSDNIFHINFSGSSLSKEQTYSILSPKNVELNFNENLYYNSDYNKIDKTVKDAINYPIKCTIPIKANTNGKYILDLDKSNIIYNDGDNNIDTNKNKNIRPIFTYASSNLNLGVKFDSFNNYLYTGYFDANNNVGTYATTLINPNYKGPILRLTNADRTEINTGNENKKGKRVANFYNDYKDDKLYTIIDDKKIYYEDFFINLESSVAILYDQSGYNNHLKYELHVFAYMPDFRYNLQNKKYSVNFYEEHILFFTKPISYKKIKIYTELHFKELLKYTEQDEKKNKDNKQGNIIFNNMNFLGARNNEVIQVQSDNQRLVFWTSKKAEDDKGEIKQISNLYPADQINDNWQNPNLPTYKITTKYIFNENKDPIILECLGNVLDVRSDADKISPDARNGKNLQDYMKKHSFKGSIYELRIFKSDED
jgi:hypothetical protein